MKHKKGKRFWTIVALVVIISFAAMFYLAGRKTSAPSSTDLTPVGEPSVKLDDMSLSGANGRYAEYDEALFNAVDGRRWLFFSSASCAQCQLLDDDIKQAIIPNDITIFKVDFDKETALKDKYGVTQPGTVVEVNTQGDWANEFNARNNPLFTEVHDALGI